MAFEQGKKYAENRAADAAREKKEKSLTGRALAIADWCKHTLRTIRSLRVVVEEED